MTKFDSVNTANFLFLDVGNTTIKGAYKSEARWEGVPSGQIKTASDLVKWIDHHPKNFERIVLASVRGDVTKAIIQKVQAIPITVLKISDIPREMLDYDSPDTLGIDRFLACYGAASLTTKAAVAIDAGTAITIDFISADDVFRGGLVAPGYYAYSNILSQKAPALPVVEDSIPEVWPGKSTRDSLRWGQAGFYKIAIKGVLEKYRQAFGDFDLFVTGGDSAVIKNILNADAKVRPFLVFEGMERFVMSIEY